MHGDTEIMKKEEINICWLRRDLRLHDNTALWHALKGPRPVLPVFIFDKIILDQLDDKNDKRVAFIHATLLQIHKNLQEKNSSLYIGFGIPVNCFAEIFTLYNVRAIYTNRDYEPYATQRDSEIEDLAKENGISFYTFKDQVIFEKSEIMKPDHTPYTVFTPYANKWKQTLRERKLPSYPSENLSDRFIKIEPLPVPSLEDIGFREIPGIVLPPHLDEELIRRYEDTRNFPAIPGTTQIGIHLRFGTVSIREMVQKAARLNDQWMNELIWREFFMMILYHFPHVVNHNFKRKFDAIPWRNSEYEFDKWCKGETGYPIVDAGMRQLNETGWMHNRVRMIVASFLCKLLLVDWQWGEAYFAQKLLDYELASNNGNWQWAAGTGCDAMPYFRIFNPSEQIKKFDPKLEYAGKWIPGFHAGYLEPMVEYKFARARALDVYKTALEGL